MEPANADQGGAAAAAPARALLVGVEASASAAAALRWAAEEAAVSGLPLVLLATYTAALGTASYVAPVTSAGLGEDVTRGASQRHLDAALAAIESGHPTVHASGRVVRGPLYDALLALAEHADALIIGAPGGDQRISRTGVLGQPLTKRSPAPVVITPPNPAAAPDGEVLVGLTMDNDTPGVLAYAFRHARRHATPIRIVCCWPPRRLPLSAAATMTFAETEQQLFDTLLDWQNNYPDVRVSASVVAAHPSAALTTEAEHARLLVIGGPRRRGAHWTLRHRLHRLLRWTHRPVAVVPAGGRG